MTNTPRTTRPADDASDALRRLAFLSEAGEALSASLDYDRILQQVARLAVPTLGDMCIVDVIEEGGMRRVATAHASPDKSAAVDELRRYPASPDSPQPAGRVLRSGTPELLADVTPDVVASHTRDPEHARLIRAIGMRSHLAVPLVARGNTLGVISLAITESSRRYGPHDVAFAEDLARRAALAVDNARLYRLAQIELAERRRAEEALRLSEERFRALMEQSPLSTQIFDARGVSIRVNRAWEALWGVTLDEIPEYNILEDPQLERQGLAPLIRRAFDGEPVALPAIRYNPDETLPDRTHHADPIRWVSAVAYPVKDDAGVVREVVLVHEDVTAARAAEEKLRTSEAATRLLADAGETLGASLDHQATLLNFSRVVVPRFADWCAVDLLSDAGELRRVALNHRDPALASVAAELFTRFPPTPSSVQGVWHVITTGQPEWVAEITPDILQQLAADPAHLAVLQQLHLRSYVCVPLMARGTAIGALTLIYAESGRQYTAPDLELATDLARRVAAAADNARLYERLRTEDRRKDEFLATLAHELRNPLAPIRTGLALLRVASDRESTERTRLIMERQVGQMVRLIDDLLDLSRVTRGKVQLEKERVDLWSIVGTALETSRPILDAAGVQLAVHLPAGPVVLHADGTRIAQVLSNLLNNAAKYTHAGGHVELAAVVDGPDVVIRVTDTGIGIPADMLRQVFGMFTQVQRSLDRSQGGLGIGLTLVERLVELHGGRVWAESEGPGRGSTFVVRLPTAHAAVRASERGPEDARTPMAPSARRVLVVDDNTDAAETLAALLRLEGHDVRTAGSGSAALDLVRTFQPEIAFLDIGLPGMSGYDLAQRLRQDPELAGMTLAAVTGWGQADDRRRSQDAGFDHHLTKPVDPRELQGLVRSARRRST